MNPSDLPSQFDSLAADEREKRDFERIWRLIRETDQERAASYDVDEEWDKLANRVDLAAEGKRETGSTDRSTEGRSRRMGDRSPRSTNRAPTARLQRWTRLLTLAVFVFGVVGGGVWWWSRPVSVTTAAGEQMVATLPDGSTAELNGSTTVTYPRGWLPLPWTGSPARIVEIHGEAFFDVVDADRPFLVQTANAEVEVLGTTFHVHARDENGGVETRVTVASGRVRVSSGGSGMRRTGSDTSAVVLNAPGQASRISGTEARPTPPRHRDLSYVGTFRRGGFAVVDASIPRIIRELEHRFGTEIRLRVSPASTERMSLHYARNAKLENVLRDICLAQNLSYRETSQGYELLQE